MDTVYRADCPPRFRVTEFPSDEQLAMIGKDEVKNLTLGNSMKIPRFHIVDILIASTMVATYLGLIRMVAGTFNNSRGGTIYSALSPYGSLFWLFLIAGMTFGAIMACRGWWPFVDK
jgi:hypothetical protein